MWGLFAFLILCLFGLVFILHQKLETLKAEKEMFSAEEVKKKIQNFEEIRDEYHITLFKELMEGAVLQKTDTVLLEPIPRLYNHYEYQDVAYFVNRNISKSLNELGIQLDTDSSSNLIVTLKQN